MHMCNFCSNFAADFSLRKYALACAKARANRDNVAQRALRFTLRSPKKSEIVLGPR